METPVTWHEKHLLSVFVINNIEKANVNWETVRDSMQSSCSNRFTAEICQEIFTGLLDSHGRPTPSKSSRKNKAPLPQVILSLDSAKLVKEKVAQELKSQLKSDIWSEIVSYKKLTMELDQIRKGEVATDQLKTMLQHQIRSDAAELDLDPAQVDDDEQKELIKLIKQFSTCVNPTPQESTSSKPAVDPTPLPPPQTQPPPMKMHIQRQVVPLAKQTPASPPVFKLTAQVTPQVTPTPPPQPTVQPTPLPTPSIPPIVTTPIASPKMPTPIASPIPTPIPTPTPTPITPTPLALTPPPTTPPTRRSLRSTPNKVKVEAEGAINSEPGTPKLSPKTTKTEMKLEPASPKKAVETPVSPCKLKPVKLAPLVDVCGLAADSVTTRSQSSNSTHSNSSPVKTPPVKSPLKKDEKRSRSSSMETPQQTKKISKYNNEVDYFDENSYRTWKNKITAVLRRVAEHRHANLFAHAVTERDAPGYAATVKRPMHLSKMKRNIESGLITSTEEFKRNLLLMFLNATMYNHSMHDVHKMAQQMANEALNDVEYYMSPANEELSHIDVAKTRRSGRLNVPSSDALL